MADKKLRRYGQWAGNPKGKLEDVECCVQQVWPRWPDRSMLPFQCSRKHGYGPDGMYCKQHAKQHDT